MKLKRTTVIEIHNTLSEFKGTSKYSKLFSMYIMLNLKKLKPTIEDIAIIQKSSEPSDEYKEVQKQEMELLAKYVERDENNKPISVSDKVFKIKPDKIDEYKQLHNQLKEDSLPLKLEYEKTIENIDNIMNEEIEVDVILIPFDCFPEEIEVDKLEKLSDIIKEVGIE